MIYCLYELAFTVVFQFFFFCVHVFFFNCFDKASYICCLLNLCVLFYCAFSVTYKIHHGNIRQHTLFHPTSVDSSLESPSVNAALWYLKFMSVTADTLHLFFPPSPQKRVVPVFSSILPALLCQGEKKKKTLWTLMHPSLIVTY